jgi:transglutaminase-like putative cysteine protease
MRLQIVHRTEYRYDVPVGYGLQRLRLTPLGGQTQAVVSWKIEIEGGREEVRYVDQFGNETRLVSMEGDPRVVSVEASGIVETYDTAGVVGPHLGFAPLWLFRRETVLTEPGPAIEAFVAASIGEGSELSRLHGLMDAIADVIVYEAGATGATTTGEEALVLRKGVCQDHAHVFLAAARLMGFPARYVSGYLMLDGVAEQAASHAWVEAHVSSLGWVGFDVSNRMCPDERYVRVAVGRDYRDAAPVSGIRLGQAAEALAVRISVEQ